RARTPRCRGPRRRTARGRRCRAGRARPCGGPARSGGGARDRSRRPWAAPRWSRSRAPSASRRSVPRWARTAWLLPLELRRAPRLGEERRHPLALVRRGEQEAEAALLEGDRVLERGRLALVHEPLDLGHRERAVGG